MSIITNFKLIFILIFTLREVDFTTCRRLFSKLKHRHSKYCGFLESKYSFNRRLEPLYSESEDIVHPAMITYGNGRGTDVDPEVADL